MSLAKCPDCGLLVLLRFPIHDCQIKPISLERHRGATIQRLSDGWAATYIYSQKVWKRGFKTKQAAKQAVSRAQNKLAKA